jgi:acyl dehydratase
MKRPTIRVGTTYERYEGRIDEDAALAYALATNEPNDIYLGGGAVPPLFTASLIRPAFGDAARRSVDPGAITGARGDVHGGHDIYFANPVRPGMAVHWRVTTHSAKQTPAGVMVIQRILVSDAQGVPLVEHFWTSFHIGGIVREDLGPDLAAHLFPAEARQRPLGVHTVELTADQTFRYAGASGDRVDHSVDDEAARREGFPGKIVQGLCTFAMCSGAVVHIGTDGDPRTLRRLVGRFSSSMFPRQRLTVAVYDAGRTEDGGRALAFEATSNGVTVIKHGRAELRPD